MSDIPTKETSTQNTLQGAAQAEKTGFHPRNKHRGRYDFKQLVESSPELAAFVSLNAYQDESIDFANPEAVRALNRALLKQIYSISVWNLPPQYLCPPIPGRADYLHYLADLLASSNNGVIPLGASIRALDIGIGANVIYPLIGHSEYGWHFVGTEVDRTALACAQATINSNNGYGDAIELRLQSSPLTAFQNVLQAEELFDVSMCNPPFHTSLDDAKKGTERKWKNLGKPAQGSKKPVLNFGGQETELCCEGGEEGFISRMIAESAQFSNRCLWFTTIVSRASSLPVVYRALKNAKVQENRTIEMAQGQKKSRIVAWTFLNKRQQQAWAMRRGSGETEAL